MQKIIRKPCYERAGKSGFDGSEFCGILRCGEDRIWRHIEVIEAIKVLQFFAAVKIVHIAKF